MESRYKICIIMGSHWARQIGGSQYQAKCIVEALLADGRWDVHYIASIIDPSFRPEGYSIHAIGRDKGQRKFGGLLWDAPKLRRTLRRIGPDVIYQRGSKAYTGLIAMIARRTNCPFVFHIAHDDDVTPATTGDLLRHSVNKVIDKRLGDYGIRRADAVIAQTEFQARQLLQHYGVHASLIAPNFHPLPAEAAPKPTDYVQVLWVANFKRSKQPELFVDLAASMSAHSNIHFVMIGRSGSQAIYGELLRRMRSMKNLQYRGELPIEQVNAELERSHLFVNTSKAEGFPNTFIQAWMRRVPVLSLIVDPDDVLQKTGAGILCNTLDTMQREILRLAADTAALARMGDAALQWANARHGPAAAANVTNLLLETAKEGRTQF